MMSILPILFVLLSEETPQIPYGDLSLAGALIIAVIMLWRMHIGGLRKRDKDREEVVQVYKDRAGVAEQQQERLAKIVENNTTAMLAMAKEAKALTEELQHGKNSS